MGKPAPDFPPQSATSPSMEDAQDDWLSIQK